MKITKKEFALLTAVALNEYNECNYGMPENASETSTWSNCLELSTRVDGYPLPEASAFGGVIASLVTKGLVIAGGKGKDATVAHTDKGYKAWRKMYDALTLSEQDAPAQEEEEVPVEVVAVEKAVAKSARAALAYGCTPSALGRWMGAHGYTAKQFKDVLTYLGVEMAASSVTTVVSDGKSEVYRGKLPELSNEHVNEIEVIAAGGKPGAKKVAKKKASRKSSK
jgi:hypothetical protein